MKLSWDDARFFLAVAEAPSVSAAARTLGVTQPTVSRRIADLERTIGEALFERHGGGSTLTPFGERLVVPARQMAEWAGEFDRLAEQSATPSGDVRITAPPGIAYAFVTPFVAQLARTHPELRVQVMSTTRTVDIARREADLALRLGIPPEEGIASFTFELAPYASREYEARLGAVRDPAEVAWIGWAPPDEGLSANSVLRRRLPDLKLAFSSNDYLIQLRACEVGLGAMLLPTEASTTEALGLVRLPLEFAPIQRTLVVLAPPSATAIPRVRAVLTPMLDALGRWARPA